VGRASSGRQRRDPASSPGTAIVPECAFLFQASASIKLGAWSWNACKVTAAAATASLINAVELQITVHAGRIVRDVELPA